MRQVVWQAIRVAQKELASRFMRIGKPVDDVVQMAPRGAGCRVLVVDPSRTLGRNLSSTHHDRIEVRSVADAESAWQTLLVDPSVNGVVIGSAAPEPEAESLADRVRASRVSRICGVPMLRMNGTDADANGAVLAEWLATLRPVEDPAPDFPIVFERLASETAPGSIASEIATEPIASLTAEIPASDEPTTEPAAPEGAAARLETNMTRFDNLNKVLKNLQSESPGVEASALISEDGLMIASALSQDLDETRVAGMTATLLSLGTRAATELRRGNVSEVIVRGEQGYAVMIGAGRGVLLLVLASASTPLGLIFFDMREAIKALRNIL
ncbi:MAG TPA: roadblock/LC7 domain-containing protein [Burkholderiaceae bacterium]|nr:roadblock/LC7 domain-containing protein [Burkholderiaceae bacterium]